MKAAESVKDIRAALVGNPNVGKSSLFNALTGLRQHTGNWPGKTVSSARGHFTYDGVRYDITDLPGTYSLLPRSEEEKVTRDHICFSTYDVIIVVCDGTCLERNLTLVLQTLEICSNVVVCINFSDEMKRKGVSIDNEALSAALGVPVCTVSARRRKGFDDFFKSLKASTQRNTSTFTVRYPQPIERAIISLETKTAEVLPFISPRWAALKLLQKDTEALIDNGYEMEAAALSAIAEDTIKNLAASGYDTETIRDAVSRAVKLTAGEICFKAVKSCSTQYSTLDKKLDRIFTAKYTAYPIMLLLLCFLFWLTVKAANYPSAWLAALFARVEIWFDKFLIFINTPQIIRQILIQGAYRVLSCVVSVMLPPMAIFFPLFTLLEDFGYLPRMAYNLDRPFSRCGSCGKQALTMCMGLGCNAVGITGCKIIDTPRERLLAAVTNSYIPCNGRFPALITISYIMLGVINAKQSSAITAVILGLLTALAVFSAMLSTKILSKTILKGQGSSFALELPPYRAPEPAKILIRSLIDRTAVILSRAITVALPAGILIWLLANVNAGGISILSRLSGRLDPVARCFGLDGVILLAFILGLPANEIILPIAMMGYMSEGTIASGISAQAMQQLFSANGWDFKLCLCTLIFMLFHWPCSTSIITLYKETRSIKWTVLGVALPTFTGLALCAVVSNIFRIFA